MSDFNWEEWYTYRNRVFNINYYKSCEVKNLDPFIFRGIFAYEYEKYRNICIICGENIKNKNSTCTDNCLFKFHYKCGWEADESIWLLRAGDNAILNKYINHCHTFPQKKASACGRLAQYFY